MSAAPKLSSDQWSSLLAENWRGKLELKDAAALSGGQDFSGAVALGRGLSPEQLLDFVLRQGARHLCQEGSLGFEKEVNVSALMLFQPKIFLKAPLPSIFDPVRTASGQACREQLWMLSFRSSEQKNEVLERLSQTLQPFTKSQSLISEACGVMDELFTNAVYNAPYGEDRRGFSLRREMPEAYSGEAFWGVDASRLVLGVRDPFGSLNIEKLLRRIEACYAQGVEKSINNGEGGAGIGSYMVYQAAASYYVAVEEGVSTVICCSLPLHLSHRQRLILPKNIHCLNLEKISATCEQKERAK